jgi:hypothetical protein
MSIIKTENIPSKIIKSPYNQSLYNDTIATNEIDDKE